MNPQDIQSVIPTAPGWPLLGSTIPMVKNPTKLLQNSYNKYGEIFWLKLFGIRIVKMLGPDANEFLLLNKGAVFANGPAWSFFIGKFFTRGIMLLDFKEHSHHRRIMQEAFKKSALEAYLKRMNPAIAVGIGQWPIPPARTKPHRNRSEESNILVFSAIKQLTLDLATNVFMGKELGPEADAINQAFFDCVKGGTAIIRFPVPLLKWHKALKGRQVLEKFFHAQIADKKQSQSNDMLSVLCRAENEVGERFSDEDIVNHMIFLMMAAHDTTTITLTSIIYQLAKHPAWQERVRQESIALGKSVIGYSDLDQLEGITLVMKEALRLCAPVPALPRMTVEDCEYKGFHIPKGTIVSISPYFTHAMETYWPNPYHFDPDRFAKHRREDKVHPYAWIPFGGGAHKCIGLHFADLQVKAILHQMLLKYRWSVDPDYRMPMDLSALPTPRDKLPLHMEAI